MKAYFRKLILGVKVRRILGWNGLTFSHETRLYCSANNSTELSGRGDHSDFGNGRSGQAASFTGSEKGPKFEWGIFRIIRVQLPTELLSEYVLAFYCSRNKLPGKRARVLGLIEEIKMLRQGTREKNWRNCFCHLLNRWTSAPWMSW